MANHKSAKKAIRKIEARTAVNVSRRSRVKTFIKKVDEAIAGGKKDVAQSALQKAQSEIMKAVGKNILKLNTASRKISRLSAQIKKLG